ncbi:helix-turn-helix domain-containing protein [Salmonella enterica subsp. salamae]|nr:helix-turn-helix domain-containing protein [Salmonella enterica subsp. salamae]EDW5993851.1 helix-turn-helix domain-containing protein [Salmonella enterica subsp. salamae]
MNKELIVLNVIERIESRLEKKENISVDEVADISGFTKRYIQKIFKEQTKMNISSYIKRRRLTKAAILIKLTKKSIYHIAMELHFSTQQAFTRAFSREFNVTPFNFRNSEHFDYSRLLPNWAIKLCDYSIKKTQIPPLKLNLESFYFDVSLLDNSSARVNKFRFSEINKVISNEKDVVIVTTIEPNSKSENIVRLHARIGYKDTENYNFQTSVSTCWEITYSGKWEDYVRFGRLFVLELEFHSLMYFIEIIKASKKTSVEKFYDVKIYLPTN